MKERMDTADNFKDRLFKVRKKILNLTQKEFADKINIEGVTEQSIAYYEIGYAFPSVDFLYAIKDNLNIDYIWLLTGEADYSANKK